MKQTKLIMGMPITVQIIGPLKNKNDFSDIFEYFKTVDKKFSTYKKNSEISKINRGLPKDKWSDEMKEIFILSAQTKKQTNGYFDIQNNGTIDPSGIVKGWAINNAAKMLSKKGYKNYYVEAGGDIQVKGKNEDGQKWQIGIRNPFNRNEIIKVVALDNQGIATSGKYIRGDHIYDPHDPNQKLDSISSLTVIGPNIYDADRFATAAFAMGKDSANFLESISGFEAYIVDNSGMATMTSGFEAYTI